MSGEPHGRPAPSGEGVPPEAAAMPWGAAETWRHVKSLVPGELVPASALFQVGEAIPLLPPGSTAYFLECRLAAGDSRLDFGACFRSPREEAAMGIRAEPWQSVSPWPVVTEVFSCWRSLDSHLSRHVPYIWLELDDTGKPAGETPPGILFCIDPSMARMPALFPELSHAGLLGVVQEASEIVLGEPLSPLNQRAMLACSAFLPAGGRIHHVSLMPARSRGALKVNVSLPKQDLPRYLDAIRWPGSRKDLARLWETGHAFLDQAKVDLSIQEGLLPTIGLELHPYNTTLSGRRSALASLEASGMGDSGKCRALAAWSGQVERIYRGHSWPTRLVEEFGLKLVMGLSMVPAAKGYLGFFPEFILI